MGIAYFLIGVIVPVAAMLSQGQLDSRGWNASGAAFATVAGALGAIGAVCIIYSFRAGGSPTYVMPLVFGGAPLVNVLYTMAVHPPKTAPNPLLCRRSSSRRALCARRLVLARSRQRQPPGTMPELWARRTSR